MKTQSLKYPNKYNADQNTIEIDQHVRALNEAEACANDATLSAETRACYRAQADAERAHIKELRARMENE